MSEDLRQMIRNLVLEELASQGAGAGSAASANRREEVVVINSDQDLARFVQRLLTMARNDRVRADIESGRHVFRLGRGAGAGTTPVTGAPRGPGSGRTARLNGALVTERQVRALAGDVSTVEVGKNVRFTPLASDALRQAGIKIKRMTK